MSEKPLVWVGLTREQAERILEHIGVGWLCLPEQAGLAAIRAALDRKGEAWVGTEMATNHGQYVLGELNPATMMEQSARPTGRVLVVPLEEGEK